MKPSAFAALLEHKIPVELARLRPELAAAAQVPYDEWDASDPDFGDDVGGFGGICDQVADAMCGVLNERGIDAMMIDNGGVGDQHVWVVARLPDGTYEVDIDPHSYESGGGYSWRKLLDVQFSADMVSISRIGGPEVFDSLQDT